MCQIQRRSRNGNGKILKESKGGRYAKAWKDQVQGFCMEIKLMVIFQIRLNYIKIKKVDAKKHC